MRSKRKKWLKLWAYQKPWWLKSRSGFSSKFWSKSETKNMDWSWSGIWSMPWSQTK